MSFRRKDSISPACDYILLPISSGTKQVSRNICERNIHVPILVSPPGIGQHRVLSHLDQVQRSACLGDAGCRNCEERHPRLSARAQGLLGAVPHQTSCE